jgi:hypothetical protein
VIGARHKAHGKEPGHGYFRYFSFGLSSYVDHLLVRIRQGVYQVFTSALSPAPGDTILDVGISENDHPSSNYLEKAYPHPGAIIGLSIEPYPSLKLEHPGLMFLCGDGRALPLKDRAVDFVYSHAVIEHVGSRANQAKFLTESLRVARKGVLLTTPNRWHPVETHTGLPFLHYLPAAIWRRLYRILGKGMYAQEETLHLFSAAQLLQLVRGLGIPGDQYELHRIRWLGVSSNLVLIVRKG